MVFAQQTIQLKIEIKARVALLGLMPDLYLCQLKTASRMSDVCKAMSLLIKSFSKYAGREGDPHTLSKAELKELLQNELGELLRVSETVRPKSRALIKDTFRCESCKHLCHVQEENNKGGVDLIFQDLDTNKDNSVDFYEYGRMIFCLTGMCHEYFTGKK